MTIQLVASATVGFLLTTGLVAAAHPPAGSRKLLAVVAIENYQSPFEKIPDARNSASELATSIQRQFGFEVNSLYDSQATLPAIDALLTQFPADLDEKSQVIFYFIGHGITRTIAGRDEGFLVPYGTQSNSRDDELLPMARLVDRLSRLSAGDVWIVLDACHSGISVPKLEFEPIGSQVSSGSGRRVRMVLTSSGGNQRSYAKNQPLLTTALRNILAGVTCDISEEGFCSVFDICLLAKRRVQGDLEKLGLPVQGPLGTQTPDLAVIERAGGDDIRLDIVSKAEWLSINGTVPDVGNLDGFLKDLNAFKAKYPWYADRAEARKTEILRELLRRGSSIEVDTFRGLALQGLPGRKAKHSVDGLMYVWVPRLGNAGPGDFWIGQTEVSIGGYRTVFPTAKLRLPGFYRGFSVEKAAVYPAVNVSFSEAEAYCVRIGGRLPTDDEWLYAATDGHPGHYFPWNGTKDRDTESDFQPGLANMAPGSRYSRPEPIDPGSPPQATSFQIHAVLGNVAEWTSTESEGGRIRIRGGSFADPIGDINLQSKQDADRQGANTIGFRCVIRP
jgi:hypothetical protein